MKRLALAVAVVSFAAFAGEPTQPPTTTAPVSKKKSLSTFDAKTLNAALGSGSTMGSGGLGTRGSSGSVKTMTPTPTTPTPTK